MRVDPPGARVIPHFGNEAIVESAIDLAFAGAAANSPDAQEAFSNSHDPPGIIDLIGIIGHTGYGVWALTGAHDAVEMGNGDLKIAATVIALGEFCKAGGYLAAQLQAPGAGLGLMVCGTGLSLLGGFQADDAQKDKRPQAAPIRPMNLPKLQSLDLRRPPACDPSS